MRLMRAAVPRMADAGWGRVVNVASSSGKRPSSSNAAYSVAKAAELSLSRVYADAYASAGVLVNAVAPGATASELWTGPGGLAEQAAQRQGTARRGPGCSRGRSPRPASRTDRRRHRVPSRRRRRHRRGVVGGRRDRADDRLETWSEVRVQLPVAGAADDARRMSRCRSIGDSRGWRRRYAEGAEMTTQVTSREPQPAGSSTNTRMSRLVRPRSGRSRRCRSSSATARPARRPVRCARGPSSAVADLDLGLRVGLEVERPRGGVRVPGVGADDDVAADVGR